jgi:hypothetical protein
MLKRKTAFAMVLYLRTAGKRVSLAPHWTTQGMSLARAHEMSY